MAERFQPERIRRFRFVDYELDAAALTARFHYAFDEGPRFCEEIVFEGGRVPATEAGRAALDRALRHLHLVAGISYYKAAVPPEIAIDSGPLPRETARFLDRLYLHGLGELAYRNGLDLRSRIRFPAADGPLGGDRGGRHGLAAAPRPRLELRRCTAVPVGGGKDSVVTIEALKAAGEPMVLFSVGDYEPIREVSRVAGVPRIIVRRRISPRLLELNERGAINGHVPISAIIAFILAAAAVVYGFDAAALSNERSADAANLTWHGLEINHQYSKSSAFERDFNELVRRDVLPGFRYFSFLRSYSELAVTAAFSRAPAAYRKVFRSCNAAFRLDELRRGKRWCRDCPKCRFVFLALAPFIPRQEAVEIFGGDMLEDLSQEKGFAEMLGLSGHKPFECVGEVAECVAALVLLARSPQWRDARLVRRFAAEILPGLEDPDRLVDEALRPGSVESVPERYRSMLPGTLTPGPSPRGRGESEEAVPIPPSPSGRGGPGG
jgi:hypothetical protein